MFFITSVVDGNLSLSHWSSYVGAVVGGAVSSYISGTYNVINDAVEAAITVVSFSCFFANSVFNYCNADKEFCFIK